MLNFTITQPLCTQCGQCAADCPARIIDMDSGYPAIAPEKEPSCYTCQHCFAICPTGAVSILGLNPADSLPLTGGYPDPAKLETLIKGRRSIRRFEPDNLDQTVMQHLLEVAWHAPTGVNSRQVRFTVVDDKKKMDSLRDEVLAKLSQLVENNALPEEMAFYANFVQIWEKHRVDIIFRDAPHLLIASVPRHVASPQPDCLIALSYFELFAQANGVGTLWNGLAQWVINDLLPETRQRLGIPGDHLIGYMMTFGTPAISYARTAQHTGALIHRVA